MPATDNIVTVQVSVETLLTATGVGLPAFAGTIWGLLKWFLGKLDKKEADYQAAIAANQAAWKADLVTITTAFGAASKLVEDRYARLEGRLLEMYDKSIAALEEVAQAVGTVGGTGRPPRTRG